MTRAAVRPLARQVDVGATAVSGSPWVVRFDAVADPTDRSALAERLVSARVERFGWLILHTCRRLEILGTGPRPSPGSLAALTGSAAGASPRIEVDEAAARHVLRLAAGLESAVLGEDQVLGQLRGLRRSADARTAVDGRLVGLLDLAIHVGRQARAHRPRTERSLADRAVSWLGSRLGALQGARLLIVGQGPIGREASRLARKAGALVVVASRTPRSPHAITLSEAARSLPSVDGVIVALAGSWEQLLDIRPTDQRAATAFIADLSAPPAIPGPVRSGFHGRLALLEDLAGPMGRPDHRTLAYVRHAEALVETALGRLRQRADPELGTSIRELREDADRRRREELDELLRGLPDLDADERRAIERFSTRLVASILHRPTLAVRDGR